MKCLVTGAAGFIGSHLCDRLLELGHEVVGLDAFIPYYPRSVKEANLAAARTCAGFRLHALDLRSAPLDEALRGVEAVFHLAAMPGLPLSWTDFEAYSSCNLLATQRLLEAVRRVAPGLTRWIHASTSSVYGRFACGDETMPTRPISPYGVTKLAAESLCLAYAETYQLPVVVLRYFSVYGPRQRPDMGYHRFIQALLQDQPITVFGDGYQARSNTYVSDCVEATVLALQASSGSIYNVGGGEEATVWDILQRLEKLAGRPARINQQPARPGDQRSTLAHTNRLRDDLGWQPRTSLDEGLARQWQWQEQSSAELSSTGECLKSIEAHSPVSHTS